MNKIEELDFSLRNLINKSYSKGILFASEIIKEIEVLDANVGWLDLTSNEKSKAIKNYEIISGAPEEMNDFIFYYLKKEGALKDKDKLDVKHYNFYQSSDSCIGIIINIYLEKIVKAGGIEFIKSNKITELVGKAKAKIKELAKQYSGTLVTELLSTFYMSLDLIPGTLDVAFKKTFKTSRFIFKVKTNDKIVDKFYFRKFFESKIISNHMKNIDNYYNLNNYLNVQLNPDRDILMLDNDIFQSRANKIKNFTPSLRFRLMEIIDALELSSKEQSDIQREKGIDDKELASLGLSIVSKNNSSKHKFKITNKYSLDDERHDPLNNFIKRISLLCMPNLSLVEQEKAVKNHSDIMKFEQQITTAKEAALFGTLKGDVSKVLSSIDDSQLEQNTNSRIDGIISVGENLTVEFKSTMSIDRTSKGQSENAFFDNIVKPICGMLNSEGGEIFIGIGENEKGEGVVHGVQSELKKFHKESEDLWSRYLNSKLKKYFKTEYLELIKNRNFEPLNDGVKIFTIKCSPIPVNRSTGKGYDFQPCSVVHPKKQGKGIEQSDIYYRNPAQTQKLTATETASIVVNRTINSGSNL